MHALLRQQQHRPWPLPEMPWVMFQSWQDLLFAHWPVPAEQLRYSVPAALTLETFNGSAWVGLVPFQIRDMHARGLPAFSPVADFPELNVRTYVRVGDKPGVYFFSLDAANRVAVMGGQACYALPYYYAHMSIAEENGWTEYSSRREANQAVFQGRYQPSGLARMAQPGTLEYFLTERYALYSVLRNGGVLRADIHHAPWLLQDARAEFQQNDLLAASGITTPEQDPVLHYAKRQDSLIWLPRTVSGSE